MAGKLIGVCVGIFRWFPVVFVTAIIVWSYYAYVVHMCLFTVTNFPERVAYLVCYHPLVVMIVWSFWRSIFTEAAAVPTEFHLTSQELEEIQKNKAAFKEILDQKGNKLLVQSRTNRGGIRYCDVCKCVKPDRSHHCSVCSRCILKMDHHCPWINNCVCYSNYKFFFLFLGYSLLCSLFVTATSCQYFIQFWMDASSGKTNMMQLNLVLLFFVGFGLGLGIGSLFSYQCSLLSENRTTLESLRTPIFRSGPDRSAYNRGCYTNFVEVFGKSKLLWFLPIFTDSGDGVNFIARISPVPVGYQSMDSSAIPIQSYHRVETTSVMVQPTSSPARFSGNLYTSTIPVGEDKDKLLKHEPRNKSSDGTNSDIVPEKQKRFM